ncbi:hypothetical protein MMC26_003698 [Xylographa opegraphella]|nr:hypothetical protein [Xylographa opegraphella]
MHSFATFVLLCGLVPLVVPRVISRRETRPRAAYTLDNDGAGAYILALRIDLANGTVSPPVKTPTGGLGLLGTTATGPAGPDGLFGQNAVLVSEDYLFTVNPGSNTVSMFSINVDNPTNLTMVGQPASTLGEFPMSVAYSPTLKMVCTINGGAMNGVSCFSTDHAKGLVSLDTSSRSLSPYLNQTTPPVGPPGTASDIFFNPASTALFAVVKGNPGTTPPTPSTYLAWPVINGRVSCEAVISQVPDVLVSFGGNFLSDHILASVDASFGVALLEVSPSFKLTEEVHTIVPNQKAICWSVYAPRFDAVYAPDTGTGIFTAINPRTGTIKSQFSYDVGMVGLPFDFAVDRTSLYFLTGNASVAVFDLEGSNSGKVPTVVQNLDISEGGSKKLFQGMATYPSQHLEAMVADGCVY